MDVLLLNRFLNYWGPRFIYELSNLWCYKAEDMEIVSGEDHFVPRAYKYFSDRISVYVSEYDMSCVSIDTVYMVAKYLYVVFKGDTGY